ncbi:MAG: glycosyltransferase family 39 protein [Tepidisphaeraceae bacterium]
MNARRRRWVAAGLALFCVAAALRVGLAGRQGLWADEFFSLAIATGHSLEHHPAGADPSQGDYVETPGPVHPDFYRRFARHQTPPAGPARVARAVFLSDTNPPLYYLLLYAWTRATGTGNVALRLFSALWAVLCFPLVWSMARQLGGRRAALVAGALWALSPACLYYSLEVRMYSLLWFVVVATAWLALRLHRRGTTPLTLALWALATAAGFLTHYFFLFVWAPIALWLMLRPGNARRARVVVATLVAAGAVMPWYVRVPESLSAWRVTRDWLTMYPDGFHPIKAFARTWWDYYSAAGPWSGWRKPDLVAVVVYGALGLALMRYLRRPLRAGTTASVGGRLRHAVVGGNRLLLWMWLAGALLGPVVFDLARGTYTRDVSRYALAGLPAALLLLALALSRLGERAAVVWLVLIVIGWGLGLRRIALNTHRGWQRYNDLARTADDGTDPRTDVVIVHSVPSGVIGVARTMRSDTPIASWVPQLEQRQVPQSMEDLLAGKRRVAVIYVHGVETPPVQRDWLSRHARRVGETPQLEAGSITFFEPREGERFFAEGSGDPTMSEAPK